QARQYAAALDRLYTLRSVEGDAPAIAAMIKTAEKGQAELDRTTELAEKVADFMAKAAGLFARGDLNGALTRVDNALALDPRNAPAQALRAKIQDGIRLAADRREALERRTREREQSIADAISEIRRALAHETAIDLCYRALDIDPDNAEVRKLLQERQDRL